MFTDHEKIERALEVGLLPPVSWEQILQKEIEVRRRAAAKQLRKERFAALLAKFNPFKK